MKLACDLAFLRASARARLHDARYFHTLSCEQEALRLAGGRMDTDAVSAAAILHDVTKELSVEDHLKLCEKWGIMVCPELLDAPAVFHQFTGAAVAEHEFGMPGEIADAIRTHTTGGCGMSELAMLLYIADLTEPTRSIAQDPHVCLVRTLAEQDLRAACIEQLSFEIHRLQTLGRAVFPDTVAALRDLRRTSMEGGSQSNA